MVSLTYGILNGNEVITPNGTDLIAMLPDGTMVAYSPGDIAWVLTCTALVWIMIPGLGYLYSGLVRRKNALSLLLMTMVVLATISIQWFIWGYSLAFSQGSGSFLGNLYHFGFRQVLDAPAPGANNKIPEIVYAIYQQMFASLVPAIAIGAAAERGRVAPVILFTFVWATWVYCPLVAWVWNPNGWAFKWGVLDYAGGIPVEVCSGTTGLAYSIYLGRRRGFGTERLAFRPHNVSHVVIGTAFLWFGWLGFNGGSTFAANIKAAMAITCTNMAGSVGGLTWMLLDYRLERKWSVVGFCTGAIAGLVAITPAAGFVGVPAAVAIGFLGSAVGNLLTSIKNTFKFDDAMDIFAVHAAAGFVGTLCTGLFAQASVAANDAILVIEGGWIDQNWKQLYKQFTWCVVGFGWTFVNTYLIMFVIDHIPGMKFRTTEEAEIIGVDEDQCGEFVHDFVYLNRDLEGNYRPNGDGSSATAVNGSSSTPDKEKPAFQGPDHPEEASPEQKAAWERERALGETIAPPART